MSKFNCFTCDKPNAALRCSRCRLAHYCGPSCQRKEWDEHKKHCVPFELFDELKSSDENLYRDVVRNGLQDVPEDLKAVPADQSEKFKDESCGICLDNLHDPVILDCNHCFCRACLEQYRSHTRDASCPYCRSKLPPDSKSVLLHNGVILYQRAKRHEVRTQASQVLRIMQLPMRPEKGEKSASAVAATTSAPTVAVAAAADTAEVDGVAGDVVGDEAVEDRKPSYESDMAAAREQLALLMNKDPNNLSGKILYATLLAEDDSMESFEKAVRIYRSCIVDETVTTGALTPDVVDVNVTCLLKISDSCIRNRRFNEALNSAKEAVSFLPSNSVRLRHCLFNICASFVGIGDYDSAVEYGHLALQMNPYYPGQYYLIAQAQFLKGDARAAIITMQKAVAMEAPWDKVHKRLVQQQLEEFIWLQKHVDAATLAVASTVRTVSLSVRGAEVAAPADTSGADAVLYTSQIHDKELLEKALLEVCSRCGCCDAEKAACEDQQPTARELIKDFVSKPLNVAAGSGLNHQQTVATNRVTLQFGYDFFRLEDGDFTFTEIPQFLQRLGEEVQGKFSYLTNGKAGVSSSSGSDSSSSSSNGSEACTSSFNNIIVSIYDAGYHLEPHIDTDVASLADDRPRYYFDEDVYGIILAADQEGKLFFTCEVASDPLTSASVAAASIETASAAKSLADESTIEATVANVHSDGAADTTVDYAGAALSSSNRATRIVHQLDEAPGVVFKLSGPIRHRPYYHGVSTVKKRRVSVTFRNVILLNDSPSSDTREGT